MNMPVLPPLKALEAAFPPRQWAAGEDYLLQDRVQELRRAGSSLAGRVLGVRDDYWIRVALEDPPISACSCGHPLCRHAAAVVQAYYSKRVAVRDADQAIDAFLARPRRAPLAAEALGEDLLSALSLPEEQAQDLGSLPQGEAVLRIEEALQAAPDRQRLLLALLPHASGEGPVQDLARAWLGELARSAEDWLRFFGASPPPLLPFLAEIEPEEWPDALRPRLLAALWQSAAEGGTRLSQMADLAARRAPQDAFWALAGLAQDHPDLIPPLLLAGERAGRGGRALTLALRIASALPERAKDKALLELIAVAKDQPKILAEAQLRRAALRGDARALLAARRAALRAGNWPRLRSLALPLLRGRPDGAALETRLLIADDDLEGAAQAADRCLTSSLPQRLVAKALQSRDAAKARVHALRADAIAQRLGETARKAPGEAGAQEVAKRPRKD